MRISSYAASRLVKAYNHSFGEQVTAYLTDAVIVACCGFGVMHRHVKAEPSGRFQDGHRLRTSDILRAEKHGVFWGLRTRSGSFYVVASFHPHGGRQSLQAFLKLREKGIHPTARHIQ
ncbi:hypothetical protein [Stutzerimonas xanthomarina]|uniref:hypothetical protein n=1 Tax=Stutzerimonas xanthomarina TaxID=271420 RepID=UPI003AA89FC9